MERIPGYNDYLINREGKILNTATAKEVEVGETVNLRGDNGVWRSARISTLIHLTFCKGEETWIAYEEFPGYEYNELGSMRKASTGRLCKPKAGRKAYRIMVDKKGIYVNPKSLIAQHPLNNQQEK